MKNKWLFPFKYFLFWVLFFVAGKAIFILYHHQRTESLSLPEVFKVFGYGLRLDASFAAYLSVLPFLLFFLRSLFPRISGRRLLLGYTGLLIAIQVLLTIVDLELYQAWGFRLDATPLQYLDTPQEMMASAGGAPVLLLTGLFLALGLAAWLAYTRVFHHLPVIGKRNWLYSAWTLWLLACLILPIRGGWQQIPLNQSDVYFSEKTFANHASVNVSWNLMYSISKKNYDQHNPYSYFPDSTAQRLVKDLYIYKESGKEQNASAPS
ncbi:MAG: hypothetical protein ACO1NZ_17555, partial [Adhaeribacter sp.]